MVDLVIKNGKILLGSELIEAGVAIDDGIISMIGKEPNLPHADEIYDARGEILLPGFIDLHVHFRDPGFPDREDFYTGTAAAAAGGFTCVGDMPNPKPSTTSPEAFEEKRRIAEAKALVDFTLYGGVGDKNVHQISGLSKIGVRVFKTYMASSYEDLTTGSSAGLLTILERFNQLELLLMIHAEDQTILDLEEGKVRRKHLGGYRAHALSRPRIAEEIAVNSAILLSEYTNTPIYICHVSCASVLDTVMRAKMRGVKVFTETCPHYLFLTEEDGERLGPYAKVNPPLRSPSDVEGLWKGIEDGSIDVVSSDHCPYTREEKDKGWSDIFSAPPGMPGLETSIPLMLTSVNAGRISLSKLTRVYSENPAKILRIYPMKGAILPGSDADITVIDLKKEELIKSDGLHTKSQVTTFEGHRVKGIPVATFVRGKLVMKDGEIIGKPGAGKMISR